jgi:hypothetical protein
MLLLTNTIILARTTRHMDRLIRDVIDIKLYCNMNWNDCFSVSMLWKPLIYLLNERSRTHSPRTAKSHAPETALPY